MSPIVKVNAVVRVNPIACEAYGYCAELLPELVTLDEWGYPVVDGSPVPSQLLDLARRAAYDCPRRAFLLERDVERRAPAEGS